VIAIAIAIGPAHRLGLHLIVLNYGDNRVVIIMLNIFILEFGV
jgi:hypothetical protein